MPTPQEEKKILAFQRKAVLAFKSLAGDLKSYGDQAKSEHKGRGNAILDKRKRHIMKSINTLPQVETFLDDYVGTDEVSEQAYSWRRTTVYLLRDYLSGQETLRDVSLKFQKNVGRYFQVKFVHENQATLRSTIPAELRSFLPPKISIEVDANGHIKKINDMFGNKTYTLSEKIKNQKKLISKYNKIVKQVQKDMKSSDEIIKLSAVITSIIMETGIRPGQIGNGIVKTIDDQEVSIETFGATTLTASHVNFVKDNFAELKFEGKKGTLNTASLSNRDVIKVLKDYVNNALESGSSYIFVTSDGKQYDYRELATYFRKNFSEFKITDFRKLRATQEVFDALQDQRDDMLRQIKQVASQETKELTQRVVEIIADTINKAHERAQVALSHDSSSTTESAYINPEVLLRFLSTASMQATLKDTILTGKTQLHFDPMMFVREAQKIARTIRKVYASGSKVESFDTLIDILENIFDDEMVA